MRDLYLVRHAVAHERDAQRWPDDSGRPLTPEGEEEFRVVARGLGRVMDRVDAHLSSPYERAWRSAEILSEETGMPAPEVLHALEADVPPRKAALALETFTESRNIVLVGHRPRLHELASYLLSGDESLLDIGLKKGGAMCLRFSGSDGVPEPGSAKLRWLLTPKMFRS